MEKETRPFISWQLADDFMTAVFEKMGVPTEDARLALTYFWKVTDVESRAMAATVLNRSISTVSNPES